MAKKIWGSFVVLVVILRTMWFFTFFYLFFKMLHKVAPLTLKELYNCQSDYCYSIFQVSATWHTKCMLFSHHDLHVIVIVMWCLPLWNNFLKISNRNFLFLLAWTTKFRFWVEEVSLATCRVVHLDWKQTSISYRTFF